MSVEEYQRIYDEAFEYLLEFEEVDQELIVNSKDRNSEDRSYASLILERIDDKLSYEEEQHNI